jgi:hypothetical protein
MNAIRKVVKYWIMNPGQDVTKVYESFGRATAKYSRGEKFENLAGQPGRENGGEYDRLSC